ncbi:hypothetical protein OUZ56_005913 [Daphnia magna]|uniref:Uncharacterized protein n=1 Tax=Daphnia magna TaxID=35525 RepID=A0ABQ9YU37_9CRUS|nr:hypothetical protein OUZ56_005913 [Daphnia magna]
MPPLSQSQVVCYSQEQFRVHEFHPFRLFIPLVNLLVSLIMVEAEAEAIPSSSKDVDVEVQTPSSGNKSQARAKASPYVVFVPSKFFEKITSNEKSTVYKCLLGCPSTRTTTVFHSSLMNARRHITVSVHSQHYYFTKETS